jgi:hypothetical protein
LASRLIPGSRVERGELQADPKHITELRLN